MQKAKFYGRYLSRKGWVDVKDLEHIKLSKEQRLTSAKNGNSEGDGSNVPIRGRADSTATIRPASKGQTGVRALQGHEADRGGSHIRDNIRRKEDHACLPEIPDEVDFDLDADAVNAFAYPQLAHLTPYSRIFRPHYRNPQETKVALKGRRGDRVKELYSLEINMAANYDQIWDLDKSDDPLSLNINLNLTTNSSHWIDCIPPHAIFIHLSTFSENRRFLVAGSKRPFEAVYHRYSVSSSKTLAKELGILLKKDWKLIKLRNEFHAQYSAIIPPSVFGNTYETRHFILSVQLSVGEYVIEKEQRMSISNLRTENYLDGLIPFPRKAWA